MKIKTINKCEACISKIIQYIEDNSVYDVYEQPYSHTRKIIDVPLPMLCHYLSDRFIKNISCGSSHSLVLDKEGYVYAAGNSDCGQLGVLWYNFNKRNNKFPFVQMPVFSDKKKAM